MRKLKITRIKRFSGSMIPYYCVVNISPTDFRSFIKAKKSVQEGQVEIHNAMYAIANGQEITIEISNFETTVFMFARTSTGYVYSDVLTIEAGDTDLSYRLESIYNLIKGLSYRFTLDK